MQENLHTSGTYPSASYVEYYMPSVSGNEVTNTTNNLESGDDDWTHVTDRRTKKRIQNRVAQRTYRSRLKQRLEELQHQVDLYQRRSGNLPNGDNLNGNSNSANLGVTSGDIPSSKSAYSPEIQDQLATSGFYDQQPRVTHSSAFLPQYLDPSSQLHATQQQQAPPSEHISFPHILPNTAMASAQMQEYLVPYQSGAMNRLMQQGGQMDFHDLSNHKIGREYGQGDSVSDTKSVSASPYQSASLTFAMAPNDLSWQTGVVSEGTTVRGKADTASASLSPGVTSRTSKPSTPGSSHDDNEMPLNEGLGSLNRLAKCTTLDDRFEYVLECVRNAGFDSFDSMVTQYYTADFSDTSVVSNEQRLSRNRRLPGVLADLREKTECWTQWEAQGYRDEILKSAESIFVAECKRSSQIRNLHETLLQVERCEPIYRSGMISQVLPAITRTFQDELPNLWALVTALTIDNAALRQRDRSRTVPASMLLLCCSGRIPTSQLGLWLNSCLENQPSKEPSARSLTTADSHRSTNSREEIVM